jgi:hypothetical protein
LSGGSEEKAKGGFSGGIGGRSCIEIRNQVLKNDFLIFQDLALIFVHTNGLQNMIESLPYPFMRRYKGWWFQA